MKQTILAFTLVMVLLSLPCAGLARQEGTITLVDSKLGTDVQNRTIAGEDTTFVLNSKVYLWLKITGANSETIKVTWKHDTYSHETELTIGGDPWRTWANKNVTMKGDWTVTVSDSKGNVLVEKKFSVHE
jgi:hypothetical protein